MPPTDSKSNKRPGSEEPLSAAKPPPLNKARTAAEEYADDGYEEALAALEGKSSEDVVRWLCMTLFKMGREVRALGGEFMEIKAHFKAQIAAMAQEAAKPLVEKVEAEVHAVTVQLGEVKGGLKGCTDKVVKIERDEQALGEALREARQKIAELDALARAREADLAKMEKQLSDLNVSMAELREQAKQAGPRSYAAAVAEGVSGEPNDGHAHGMGVHAVGSGVPTVGEALRREAEQFGCRLRLQGFVNEAGLTMLSLRRKVASVLSDLVGEQIEVKSVSRWEGKGGKPAMLLVTMGSFEEAAAVWKLKGEYGGRGSKLGEGQRMWKWFGPVEMAVRDVLFMEVKKLREQGQVAWVGRSTIYTKQSEGDARGRPMQLSPEAIASGLLAIHRGASSKQSGGGHQAMEQ